MDLVFAQMVGRAMIANSVVAKYGKWCTLYSTNIYGSKSIELANHNNNF